MINLDWLIKPTSDKIGNLNLLQKQVTAKQVHDEIYLSGDELVQVLVKQLADYVETPINSRFEERGRMLRNCGFDHHPDLLKFKENQKKIDEEQRLIREKKEALITIEKFYQLYPDYKIVHFDDLEKICRNYGLQIAPAAYYIGDLPDKNLKEISNFFAVPENEFSHVITYRNSDYEVPWSNYQRAKRFERDPLYWVHKRSLQVCCLAKDLKKDWKHLDQLKEQLKDDPIVFVRYNQFAIILSAWGAEAEDVKQL